VISIKSGAGLGFAVAVDDLRVLLERQRPMPIERWLTIGALDRDEWSSLLGGEWRQRAGRLVAVGSGRTRRAAKTANSKRFGTTK
jgi:hypothetical protein